MLSVVGRSPAAVVVEPIAKKLVALGISPNTVTVTGTVLACLSAAILIPLGYLVPAAAAIAVLTAFDLVDGTMARLKGGGTAFGATLDASCDRVTDGVLFAAITWWLVYRAEAHPAFVAASLIVLVSSQVISYVKARGEASGLKITGGLVERAERLILGLLGLALAGIGVSYALEISLLVLAVGSVFTIIQRLVEAARGAAAGETIAAPAGAKTYDEKE